MSEITLISRELTFFDMEFKESDVSANDKLQNIINEVIEGGESSSTAHMILGSIDYDNKQNLNESYEIIIQGLKKNQINFIDLKKDLFDIEEYPFKFFSTKRMSLCS